MSFDPSEFDSSDEHIDDDYIDYLDEMHPQLSDDNIDELAGEYLIIEREDDFQELDFDDDIPI